MTTQSNIKFWQEKIKQEKLRRDFKEFERQENIKAKNLKKEYFKTKYAGTLDTGKKIGFGFKQIGKGFMSGIREMQKLNSRGVKKK